MISKVENNDCLTRCQDFDLKLFDSYVFLTYVNMLFIFEIISLVLGLNDLF